MTTTETTTVETLPRDAFSAPAEADLSYISADLRSLAVRVDSLVLDDTNVKDHGEEDLPTHAASLKEFGVRRAVVVRRSNRQIEAGNGSVMACKLNGWAFVPVIFEDDDHKKARAFALADNAVGTLAAWNEDNLRAAAAEAQALFDSDVLKGIADQVLAQVEQIEQEQESQKQERTGEPIAAGDIMLSRRVIATCASEDEQINLLAELQGRGFECRLSTVRVT